jgi:hypothetical protein
VTGTGTVNGITLTGDVTAAGNLTLGGTLGNVDLAAQVTGALPVANGGTGSSGASGARTSLGIGTMGTQNANSVAITGGAITGITDLAVEDGGTGASNAAAARTNLGIGSIATQASSAVSITGGTITGITDLAITDGGTGASNPAAARTNLGLSIGSDVPSPTGTGSSGTWPISASGLSSNGWTITATSTTLTIQLNGVVIATFSSAGNFAARGNVTAYQTF